MIDEFENEWYRVIGIDLLHSFLITTKRNIKRISKAVKQVQFQFSAANCRVSQLIEFN